MKKTITILIGIVLAVLPVTAQITGVQNSDRSSERAPMAPSAAFRSTSTLVGSGSVYTATPTLNADGTANTDVLGTGAGSAAKSHPGNPRRIAPVDPKDPPNLPLGDGWMTLLFLAMVYAVVRFPRKRRQADR